jgi:hypothetical protein
MGIPLETAETTVCAPDGSSGTNPRFKPCYTALSWAADATFGAWSGGDDVNQLVARLKNLPKSQLGGKPPIVTNEIKQGVYIATPKGELLEWMSSGGSSIPGASYATSADVVKLMERALKKWGNPAPKRNDTLLAEKDYLVSHGLNVDGIVLRITTRDLPRKAAAAAGKTKWSLAEFREDWNLNYAAFTRDRVPLSLHDPLTLGAKQDVLGELIFFLARDYLIDNVHGTPPPPDGAKVKRTRLTAEVVGIAKNLVSLRLEGETVALSAEFGYDAKILGRASYDLDGKKWTAMELVAVGSRRGAQYESGRGPWQGTPVDSGPAPMGIVCTLVGNKADSDTQTASVLAERAKDPDARVRWVAAQSLGTMRLDAKAAVPALGQLLDDESREVRAH